MRNIVKYGKYNLAKFANFVFICITCGKAYIFRQISVQIYTNFQTSQGCIFRVLQHFTTKLCNVTNFEMLFLAVLIDFRHQNLVCGGNCLFDYYFRCNVGIDLFLPLRVFCINSYLCVFSHKTIVQLVWFLKILTFDLFHYV